MTMTGVIIKFFAKEGSGDKLSEHLLNASSLASNEAGTLLWTVHTSPTEADVVWVYEVYSDEAARAAHEQTAAYARVKAETSTLLKGAPEIIQLQPVGGKGLG